LFPRAVGVSLRCCSFGQPIFSLCFVGLRITVDQVVTDAPSFKGRRQPAFADGRRARPTAILAHPFEILVPENGCRPIAEGVIAQHSPRFIGLWFPLSEWRAAKAEFFALQRIPGRLSLAIRTASGICHQHTHQGCHPSGDL
jgi:hypothetical protein